MPKRSLSKEDLHQVLDTVLRLNSCRTVAGFSHFGVPTLLELIPADVFSVEMLRLNGEPIHSVTAPGWPFTRE